MKETRETSALPAVAVPLSVSVPHVVYNRTYLDLLHLVDNPLDEQQPFSDGSYRVRYIATPSLGTSYNSPAIHQPSPLLLPQLQPPRPLLLRLQLRLPHQPPLWRLWP